MPPTHQFPGTFIDSPINDCAHSVLIGGCFGLLGAILHHCTVLIFVAMLTDL
jgi:hypothetical protein